MTVVIVKSTFLKERGSAEIRFAGERLVISRGASAPRVRLPIPR